MYNSTILNNQIYYFSGTGNAWHVSKWMQEVAFRKGIDSQIINIGAIENRLNPTVKEGTLIGFVAPTHGFNFPPIMFHFILRFPRSKSNRVFIMNTRAGMKTGKLFLPGLSGLTQFLAAAILLLKGYKIVGMCPIDLPSNWISLHPGLKQKVVESIYLKQQVNVRRIGENIFNGKTNYRAVYDLIQDLIISPVALGYYIIGRFIIAKSFIASSACNNCGLCIKQCPIKAIKKIGGRPFWTYRCENCMRCMNSCPKRAIETAHGYFAAVIILTNAIVLSYFYQDLGIDKFLNNYISVFYKQIVVSLLSSIIIFLMFISTYFLMHFLLRFKWFEKMIVLTSLTRYSFWRRYKSGTFNS